MTREPTVLAIDFGTCASSAATWVDGRATPITVKGSWSVPSAMAWDPERDRVVVGAAALQLLGSLRPESRSTALIEPMPKMRLNGGTKGSIVLGVEARDGRPGLDREFAMVDVVQAVLAPLVAKAVQDYGRPDRLVFTHPVRREKLFQAILGGAAVGLGLADSESDERISFLPEPVAAAHGVDGEVDGPMAIVDFGGGTVDVAVVAPADGGWEVAGPTSGDPERGGVHMDRLLQRELRGRRDHASPSFFANLPRWQVAVAESEFDRQVIAAKEELSDDHESLVLFDHEGRHPPLAVSRKQFEELIDPMVGAVADLLVATLAKARLSAGDIARVELVGGASKVPLVRERIAEQLEELGASADLVRLGTDPKRIVVAGAARHATRLASARSDEQEPPSADRAVAPDVDETPSAPAGPTGRALLAAFIKADAERRAAAAPAVEPPRSMTLRFKTKPRAGGRNG